MRSILLLLIVPFLASFAAAQDDAAAQAMQAAQAAQQAAMQNMQDLQRANQEANEQAMREMQQVSADAAQNAAPVVAMTAVPSPQPLDSPRDKVVRVHFVFARAVTSAKAEIGDKVPLTLADDLIFNGATLARKGASTSVTIMQVDKTGPGGAPGELHFRIDPMQTDSGVLTLHGAASLECQAQPPNAEMLIPVVGAFLIFHHGKDAVIEPGTPFVAYLDSSSLPAAEKN